MRRSALANVRAHLRFVSRVGHNHAVSMCAWPIALTRCASGPAELARAGAKEEDLKAIDNEIKKIVIEAADFAEQARFFERHLKPWASRMFADLEMSRSANFYRAVGRVGRVFMELEAEAFTLS